MKRHSTNCGISTVLIRKTNIQLQHCTADIKLGILTNNISLISICLLENIVNYEMKFLHICYYHIMIIITMVHIRNKILHMKENHNISRTYIGFSVVCY